MKHCDDYIDDKSQPKMLRDFLRYHRWPAHWQYRAEMLKVKKPLLFADYEGKRVKVTMASRFGDVGITTNLYSDKPGYSETVAVEQLTNFSNTIKKNKEAR